ncbi:MAG: hypothetical protein LBD02_02850 [Christensenellaceae bacterium]|nr:hypothetical protein [Christensenellaceae bacterium]
MQARQKRRWGDRYDGRKVRKLDPMFLLIPHVMRTRVDAQVYMEEELNITAMEALVSQEKENIPGLTLLHVILAALVRMVSQRPRLNRFSSGGNIYARNYFRISMMVKEKMSDGAPEACVMPCFELSDCLADVVLGFNAARDEALRAAGNSTDGTVRILGAIPGCIRRGFINLMRGLDAVGWMPRRINRVSPFHSSFFVTSMGSIGIDPIYHHLYEFGTTSVFIALGKKRGEREDRTMLFRFVLDERICDGYYYAQSVRKLRSYFKNPAQLLKPPEEVFFDDGI